MSLLGRTQGTKGPRRLIRHENDNAPVFTSLNYTVSVSEDIPVGTSFLQVTASDEDIGNNAIVDYFFEEEDEFVKMDLFRIDRSSGTIRVNSKLDRETAPRWVHYAKLLSQSHSKVQFDFWSVCKNILLYIRRRVWRKRHKNRTKSSSSKS
ncbi:hypothetical protein L596_005075 [Steinernema carpocapsae]|uniref:Cadherin domain-containing protein n=1 Tax=Steinernema carpocapsae TaxID=34508 RepID=A0A4U8UYW4_STECR|nr:hypothetical protein L596_005075 [Steinernema carpocapsae]